MVTKNTIVVCGLGNPEKKYDFTPHNIGFAFIDYLSQKWQIPVMSNKYQALFGLGHYQKTDIMLLKPLTYMNRSGKTMAELLKKNPLHIANLLIIHDEVDLACGSWNTKEGGGHRGHNGLRDIISCIGSNDFWRMRIGVGRPDSSDLAGYLLRPMFKENYQTIETSFDQIEQQVVNLLPVMLEKICQIQ